MVKKKNKAPCDPMIARPAESDEEEDYEVADLSAVAAPQIEFVMPNLTPLEGSRSKAPEKIRPKKLDKKRSQSSEDALLTANLLNIEIVRLRSVVQKARSFLVQRLVRKMKRMESWLAKKPKDALQRKVRRFEDEIRGLKAVPKDDVSKFALLNKKTLSQLGITGKTPVNERCLYKLACEPPVVKAVNEFRSRYPSWETTTAFLLQRLGLQYAAAKEEKKLPSVNSEESESDTDATEETARKKTQPEEASSSKKAALEPKIKTKPLVQVLEEKKCDQNEDSSEYESGLEEVEGSSEEESGTEDTDSSCDSDEDVEIGTDSDKSDERTAERRRALLLGNVNESRVIKKAQVQPSKEETGPSSRAAVADEQPKTAVVKKLKLADGGKVKLGKRLSPIDSARSNEVKPNRSDPEGFSFFLPASTPLQTLKDTPSESDGANFDSPVERAEDSSPRKRVKLAKPKGPVFKKKPIGAPSKQEKFRGKMVQPSKGKQFEDSNEKLHPSWAARRQAKERQLAAPQGKRIVFDD